MVNIFFNSTYSRVDLYASIYGCLNFKNWYSLRSVSTTLNLIIFLKFWIPQWQERQMVFQLEFQGKCSNLKFCQKFTIKNTTYWTRIDYFTFGQKRKHNPSELFTFASSNFHNFCRFALSFILLTSEELEVHLRAGVFNLFWLAAPLLNYFNVWRHVYKIINKRRANVRQLCYTTSRQPIVLRNPSWEPLSLWVHNAFGVDFLNCPLLWRYVAEIFTCKVGLSKVLNSYCRWCLP